MASDGRLIGPNRVQCNTKAMSIPKELGPNILVKSPSLTTHYTETKKQYMVNASHI